MLSALQAIDIGLFACGVVSAVAFVVWAVRRGRWRNPLADLPRPWREPSGLAALGVIVALYALQLLAINMLTRGFPEDALKQVGSAGWQRVQLGDTIARVLLTGIMLLVLAEARRRPLPPVARPLLPDTTNTTGDSPSAPSAPPALSAPIAPSALSPTAIVADSPTLVTLEIVEPPLVTRLLWTVATFCCILPVTTLQLKAGALLWQRLHPGASLPMHPILEAIESGTWNALAATHLAASAIFIAPVAEELLFRGVLLGALARYTNSRWAGILGSSVLFGLVHGQPQDILPLVTMGVMLGFLRCRMGALWLCIVAHALFNARTIAFALLAPELLRPT